MRRISIPYKKWFGEMGLPDDRERRRIEAAKDIEDIIMLYFEILKQYRNIGTDGFGVAREVLVGEYIRLFGNSEALRNRAYEFADALNDITRRKLQQYDNLNNLQTEQDTRDTEDAFVVSHGIPKSYWTSQDRAMAIAENEANTVVGCEEMEEAIEAGYQNKIWVTVGDNRVRDTHREVDGLEIPINEAFEVGDSLLMYPRDTSLGASPDEIDNCRCWLEYS